MNKLKLDGLAKYHEDYQFSFDKIFNIHANNDRIFQSIIEPLLNHILNNNKRIKEERRASSSLSESNAKATCFAYGQTGSGKTLLPFSSPFKWSLYSGGSIYLAHGSIQVSFYEIYQSQLYDLLGGRKKILACEKDGQVSILGLTEEIVKSIRRSPGHHQSGIKR